MMKRTLLLVGASALAFVLGYAGPGFSSGLAGDVDQTVEVEHEVTGNQREGSTAVDPPGGFLPTDLAIIRFNRVVTDSFKDAKGVMTVQQINGTANAATIGVAVGAETATTSITQTLDIDALVTENIVGQFGVPAGHLPFASPDRNNEILSGAFDGARGIGDVQQNNGDANSLIIADAVLINAGAEDTITQTKEIGDGEGDDIQVSGNYTWNGFPDGPPTGTERVNLIDDAFREAKGLFKIQQNNGDANSLIIAVAIANNDGAADIVQDNDISVEVENNTTNDRGVTRDNKIDFDAFKDATGVFNIQQNNGDANSLLIAKDIATNLGAGNITQTSSIVISVQGNDNTTTDEIRTNSQPGAFPGAQGVANVQQNNGNGNAMTQKLDLAANTFEGDDPDLSQNNQIHHTVLDNPSTAGPGTRTNSLTAGAYDGFNGVVDSQQNNGNGNAMTIANLVVVDLGDGNNIEQKTKIIAEVGSSDPSPGGLVTITDNAGNIRHNLIDSSFNGVAGLFNVQQNNGDGNSLAIATSLGVNTGGPLDENDADHNKQKVVVVGKTDPRIVATQEVGSPDPTTGDPNAQRSNRIFDSFNEESDGIAKIQQNNGSFNTLAIANAVWVDQNGVDQGDFPNKEELKQKVITIGKIEAGDSVIRTGYRQEVLNHAERRNEIRRSFEGFEGIVAVQQNNGDANHLAIADAVYGDIGTHDDVDIGASPNGQFVFSLGKVTDTKMIEPGWQGRANNHIGDGSSDTTFHGFSGVASVQQNNANNSVLSIANAVLANQDTELRPLSDIGVASTVKTRATIEGNELTLNRFSRGNMSNVILKSFNEAQGLASVQQVNGGMHVVLSPTAIAATTGSGDPDTHNFGGPIVQLVDLESVVAGNIIELVGTAETPGGHLVTSNELINSFTGFEGVAKVQQVNGYANAVTSAISVVANASIKDRVPHTPLVPTLPGIDP